MCYDFSHFSHMLPHHAFLTLPSCLTSIFLILYPMLLPYAAATAPTAQHMFVLFLPYAILPSTMTMPHFPLVYKLTL